MFRFGKKKQIKEVGQVQEEELKEWQPAELKEYISVDAIKAHLVDTLEENRRLRAEHERIWNTRSSEKEDIEKQREVAVIQADEYKKRLQEENNTNMKLKTEIVELKRERDRYKEKYNDCAVKVEMADKARKEAEIRVKELEDQIANRSEAAVADEAPKRKTKRRPPVKKEPTVTATETE